MFGKSKKEKLQPEKHFPQGYLITYEALEDFKKHVVNLEYGGRNNTVVSKNVKIGFRNFDRRHGSEDAAEEHSVAVVGGTEEDKIRNVVDPNIRLVNRNYIVMDTDGLLYKKYKNYLESYGYDVLLYDPLKHQDECFYNFFAYVNEESEYEEIAQILVENWNHNHISIEHGSCNKSIVLIIAILIEYICVCMDKKQRGINEFLYIQNKLFEGYKDNHNDNIIKENIKKICEEIVAKNNKSKVFEKYDFIKNKSQEEIESWSTLLHNVTLVTNIFNLCDGCKSEEKYYQPDTLKLESLCYKRRAIFIYTSKKDYTYDQIIALLCYQIIQMMRAQMNIIWDSIACPLHYLSLPNGEVVYSESLEWTSIEEYKKRLTNITIQKNEILEAYDIFDNTGALITRRKNKNEAEQYVSDINNVETKSTCGVPTAPLFILHMDRIKFPTSKCTCETDTAYFSFIQISSRPYRMGYILLINDVQHFCEIYPKDPAKNPFAHCWYKVYLPSSDIYAKEMFMEEQLRRCWLVKEVKKRPFNKIEIQLHPFEIFIFESWKCVTKMTDNIDIEEKMAKENIRKIINRLNDKQCIVASRYPMMIDIKITEDSEDK